MCNLYDVGPAPGRVRFDWESGLRELLGDLGYVAPGKPGIVARAPAGKWEAAIMRWGFHRSWSPFITNARDDKLQSNTWAAAWRERRCLLPVRQFYEWSGPAGRKTRHAILTPEDDVWFWIGGIWEEHPNAGVTYAMVTTAANPQMVFLHGRMPLILAPGDLEEYLMSATAPMSLVKPYAGDLRIQPPSPSVREETGELF